MIDWLSNGGWGTREQAIPGEWALLVLIIVGGGVLGFFVLWFTMLRHERTVLHRARRRAQLEPGLIGPSESALFDGAEHGAEHRPDPAEGAGLAPIEGADDPGDGGDPQDSGDLSDAGDPGDVGDLSDAGDLSDVSDPGDAGGAGGEGESETTGTADSAGSSDSSDEAPDDVGERDPANA